MAGTDRNFNAKNQTIFRCSTRLEGRCWEDVRRTLGTPTNVLWLLSDGHHFRLGNQGSHKLQQLSSVVRRIGRVVVVEKYIDLFCALLFHLVGTLRQRYQFIPVIVVGIPHPSPMKAKVTGIPGYNCTQWMLRIIGIAVVRFAFSEQGKDILGQPMLVTELDRHDGGARECLECAIQ